MRLRKYLVGALLTVLALSLTGCITEQVISNVGGLKPEAILDSPQVTGIVGRGQDLGRTFAEVACIILLFELAFMAMRGAAWLDILTHTSVPVAFAILFISGAGQSWGADAFALQASRFMGERFQVPSEGGLAFDPLAASRRAAFKSILDLQEIAADREEQGTLTTFTERAFRAVAWFFGAPSQQMYLAVNAILSTLVKLVAHTVWTYLFVFYATMAPLLSWTLITPRTRAIFTGFLKQWVGVCLWPMLWSITEQISQAFPYGQYFGIEGGNPLGLATAVSQSQLILVVFNLVNLTLYLAIPIAAYKIVSGVSSPIRGIVS